MRDDNETDKNFRQQIINFLYAIIDEVLWKHEEDYYLQRLEDFIDNAIAEGSVTKNLLDFTEEYVRTKFTNLLDTLCFRHYKYIPCGWRSDNCFSESNNGCLVMDPQGPKVCFVISIFQIFIFQILILCS